jgi:hypothetical protein
MRKASKPPSEWLNLLCREWAAENQVLVETTDAKFLDYKPYLKGLITSQLLCRLSIPSYNSTNTVSSMKSATGDNRLSSTSNNTVSTDFWEILGITDSFDRAYIIAQVRNEFFALMHTHKGTNSAYFSLNLCISFFRLKDFVPFIVSELFH